MDVFDEWLSDRERTWMGLSSAMAIVSVNLGEGEGGGESGPPDCPFGGQVLSQLPTSLLLDV